MSDQPPAALMLYDTGRRAVHVWRPGAPQEGVIITQGAADIRLPPDSAGRLGQWMHLVHEGLPFPVELHDRNRRPVHVEAPDMHGLATVVISHGFSAIQLTADCSERLWRWLEAAD